MNWTVAKGEDVRSIERLAGPNQQYATITFRIKGRSSHAGNNPSGGINAVVEMADLIRRVNETVAGIAGTRLHWRMATGGTVGNVIPDAAQAVVELAIPRDADLAATVSAIGSRGAQAMIPGAQVSVETANGLGFQGSGRADVLVSADIRVPDAVTYGSLVNTLRQQLGRQKSPVSSLTIQEALVFPPFNASAEGQKLAETARDIYQRLGGELGIVPRTYGGTDAAWAAQSGKPVMENLGLPGGNYHSTEAEFILIDRIGRRVALAAEMIRAASRP